MDGDALLDGLTAAQKAAVTSTAEPLCVIAGAGSGKTRVLTRRIAYRAATGTLDPSHTLVLTFTRKAAGELRQRLVGLEAPGPVAAGTFHAVALAQLRQRWADAGTPAPAILDSKSRLLGPRLASSSGPPAPSLVARVAGEIEWAKARLVRSADYPTAAATAGRRPPLRATLVADAFAAYEAEKRRRGVIDLDDVLLLCAEAIETDRRFAEAQRWRWQHLFVDEYQDVNPAHARLLAAWLGPNLDLCVVGDPHQAIYGWNGADASLLTGFTRRHPTAELVELGDNFRSTPEILAVAGAVLGRPAGPLAGGAAVAARRGRGPVPTVTAYATDLDEAAAVARAARDHHVPGSAWSRMAVLARTNAQLALIADAFTAATIPHRVRGGRPLAGLPEVRDLLSGAVTTRPASTLVPDARALLAGEAGGGGGGGGASRRPDSALASLIDAVAEYADLDRTGTVAGFVTWLEATEAVYEGSWGDAVVVSTFHRAKGLEWPVVFAVGLEDGLVPLARGAGSPPLAEERRLLYVGLTRAQRELHCSWARQRRFGAQLVARVPSPFLGAVNDTVTALDNRPGPPDPVPAIRAARQRLTGGANPTAGQAYEGSGQGLLEALLCWRSAAATAARVAPAAVLPDQTLRAAAAHRPSTRAELSLLPGLGPMTAARWGEALLALIAEHS